MALDTAMGCFGKSCNVACLLHEQSNDSKNMDMIIFIFYTNPDLMPEVDRSSVFFPLN
jgi:hypothetical protein